LQEKFWMLRVIKRICTINILNETTTPPTEMEGNLSSFRFGNFSFANTVIRDINPLIKSVIYDSGCSDPLTYDKDRFLGEIKPVSKDIWIKIPNGRMKVEGYGTMQVLGKSGDKIIKMKFANTTYVLITSITLVSFIKLIKEGYDRDMHTKTLVHVATGKKVIVGLAYVPSTRRTTSSRRKQSAYASKVRRRHLKFSTFYQLTHPHLNLLSSFEIIQIFSSNRSLAC
jgi:hypothetical protein